MAGDGGENTTPATTPDGDAGGLPTPEVLPSMSDDAIRAALRTGYLHIADYAAAAFPTDKDYPTKDLASFKVMLANIWYVDDESWRARYEKLQAEVIEDVAPTLFSYLSSDDRHTVTNSQGESSTVANVAQASDPVQLFDGDFRYSTVDFHINGAGIDFVFARTYSQLTNYTGPMGEKWDHSYNLWIRVDAGGTSLHRLTGALTEETFARHETFGYWVPPAGVHGIVVEDGDSFVFARSDGSRITYERQAGVADFVYLATRIADRFGNALTLSYTDGLPTRVLINQPDRRVEFGYDDQQRITTIRDYTGRVWRYDYDAEGDLVAATMPATAAQPYGVTTSYEYLSPAVAPPELAHHLTTILDADGRLYLENDYGTDIGLLSYRRVVAQRQGSGEVQFDYADVVEDFDMPYAEHERPYCQTVVTERDGQQTRHLFNRQGNMLLQEEVGRVGGLPVLLTTHYRYNRDGNLVGVISPLGSLTQALFGRDLYERQFGVPEGIRPEQDPNLTPQARLAFGNLLTVVKRGSQHSIGQLSPVVGLWSENVFPDILGVDDTDAIQKFTYEPDSGQVLTSSDPRATRSADPDAPEDAEYQRRLTRYTYATGPVRGQLTACDLPTPTLPDGQPAAPVRSLFSAYDGHGRIVETVAPNGLRTVNEYAPDTAGVRAGFLTGRTIDPGGFDLQHGLEPDDLGRTVRVSRPSAADAGDGRFVSTVTYDELDRIVEMVSTPPQSIHTRISYDRTGNLASSELELADATGTRIGAFVTTNRYNVEAQVVNQRIGDPAGQMTKTKRIKYDCADRPALVISPAGRICKLRYDERSLVSAVIDDLAGVRAVTRRFYDADGHLALLVDPRGATTRYTYDAFGHNTEVEDPLGNRLVRHFDKLGNPLAECFFERRSDDEFVLVHRREFAYDELSRLVTVAANRFPAQGPVAAAEVPTAFRDTGPGRLLQLRFFRDVLGNVVKEIDQDGREFAAQFDLLGRAVARSDPLGNDVHLRYDKEGNIVRADRREVTVDATSGAVIDEQWFAESFSFDELNRMTAHQTMTGNALFSYDSRGLATAVRDRAGNRTEHDYDVFGRPIETRQLLEVPGPPPSVVPIRTAYAYNRDDQLTSQADPRGRTTRFEYDTAGRLRGTVLPDQTSDDYSYDQAGNVIAYRDRNGLRRDLTWDMVNRMTQVTVDTSGLPPGIAAHGALQTRFDYDALGRITFAANDFATTRIGYDSLAEESQTVSFTAASGLDPAPQYVLARETSDTGAVTALTYPSGRRLRFGRDVLDRVVEVAQTSRGQGYAGDPGTPDAFTIASVEYQGLRPRRITRGNGVTTAYRYDFSGRAVDLEHRTGTSGVLRQQTLYDPEGKVRQRAETDQGLPRVQQFGYDSLARLTRVGDGTPAPLPDLSSLAAPPTQVPDPVPDRQPEIDALIGNPASPAGDYTYDEAGNRLTARTSSGTHAYQPNDVDEYADVDGRPRTYDLNGNRTGDDGFGYGYDYRDQLVELWDKNDTSQTSFLRDAFGRICAERSGPGARALLYEGRHLIEEYTGTALLRSVVSADRDDQYLLTSSGGAEGYLLNDLTRSVRLIFDATAVRSTYRYDEFGRLLTPISPADDNVFFYAGMRTAGPSGSYDCYYRTYDPADGRFLQRDPSGFVDGTNLYTYARNDPLSRSDPMGTESRQEHPQIASRIGAELAYTHPRGETLVLPNNFDQPKINTTRKRINDPLDRGVGIRSRPPGMKTSTTDIRQANRQLRDDFEASLPGGTRPGGTDIDHTVELQHIIRQRPGQFAPGADTVRAQDHRVQDSSLNRSQGSRAQKVKAQQVRNGAPLDTSAGGVARERDANKFWNREGYRRGVRYFGYYNLVGGTYSSLTSVGDSIREGDFVGAGVNTSLYLGGAFETAGLALAKFGGEAGTLLGAGRWLGAPGAVVSSFVIGVRIGTNLYQNYVDKDFAFSYGSWIEEKTGSRILGATAAAGTAVGDAIIHLPEAGYDYVKDNVTLDPDKIDWGRTAQPWTW